MNNLKEILESLIRQRNDYQKIFRDGQDTAKRNFVFEKNSDVICEERKAVKFSVRFVISNDTKPTFEITVSSSDKTAFKTYGESFLKEVYEGYGVKQIGKDENSIKYEIAAEDE